MALHLLRMAMESMAEVSLTDLKFVHFVKDGEFDEIAEFRAEVEQQFGIKIALYEADFKREVARFIEDTGVKAIVMGNRRTDPWSKDLEPICESSPGWPVFMRVFPILDWDYHAVWRFLKDNDLSYCKLYDLGYTSLGEKNNSRPNPHLACDGGFKAAHELEDGDWERDSRC